jgi:hypothetical protein
MILTTLLAYVIRKKWKTRRRFIKPLVSLTISLMISVFSSIPLFFQSNLMAEWSTIPLSFPFYFTLSQSPLEIYPPIFILRFYLFGLPLYTISEQWVTYISPILMYAFVPFACINLLFVLIPFIKRQKTSLITTIYEEVYDHGK